MHAMITILLEVDRDSYGYACQKGPLSSRRDMHSILKGSVSESKITPPVSHHRRGVCHQLWFYYYSRTGVFPSLVMHIQFHGYGTTECTCAQHVLCMCLTCAQHAHMNHCVLTLIWFLNYQSIMQSRVIDINQWIKEHTINSITTEITDYYGYSHTSKAIQEVLIEFFKKGTKY